MPGPSARQEEHAGQAEHAGQERALRLGDPPGSRDGVRLSLENLWYHLRLRVRGIDLAPAPLPALGLAADRANPHGNSGGPSLARLLRALDVPPGSRAIDLGSGKGGAILTLAGFAFEEIVGLELSAHLIRIARDNVRRARVRRVSFVQGDAADFVDLDRFTHVYMYHPFPCAVVESVTRNLAGSLARRERELTVLYANPVCHRVLATSGLFRTASEGLRFHPRAHRRHTYNVYVHDG